MKTNRTLLHSLLLIGGALSVAGCHTDMWRQPKSIAQQDSDFFADNMTDRPRVEGTVPFGKLNADKQKYTAREGTKLTAKLPATLVINGEKLSTATDLDKILKRGKERYMIFCSHCHGAAGDGKGMIAQRGLSLRRPPATYHTDRLRKMPIGHFFDVVTNGYGIMFPMASKVEPDDRWAIASYIRVLQESQNARIDDVPFDQRETLDNPGAAKKEGAHGDAH